MTNEELFERCMFDELYKQNTGFIYKQVHRFKNLPADEVISLGNIGFVKAVKSYSLDKKTKFLTFASRCIINEILMHFRKEKKYMQNVNLESPISCDDDGNTIAFEDIIPDKYNLESEYLKKSQIEDMRVAISMLPDKQKQVISYRLKEMDQREIGKRLNLSQSYVCRILESAKRQLAELMKRGDLMNKKDKIIKLVKEGFSNKEISERIGVSTNMVSVYKAEYNKRIKNKGIVQEDIQLPVEKKEVAVVRKPLLKITGLEGNIMNYLLSDSTINLKSKCTDKSMSLSKENINIFIQELKELRQWTL